MLSVGTVLTQFNILGFICYVIKEVILVLCQKCNALVTSLNSTERNSVFQYRLEFFILKRVLQNHNTILEELSFCIIISSFVYDTLTTISTRDINYSGFLRNLKENVYVCNDYKSSTTLELRQQQHHSTFYHLEDHSLPSPRGGLFTIMQSSFFFPCSNTICPWANCVATQERDRTHFKTF